MKMIKLFFFFFFLILPNFATENIKTKSKYITFKYSFNGLFDRSFVESPLFPILSMDSFDDERIAKYRDYNFYNTHKLISQYGVEYSFLSKSKEFYYLLGGNFKRVYFLSNDLYHGTNNTHKSIENSIFQSLNFQYFFGFQHFFKNSIFTHRYVYEALNSDFFEIDSIHLYDAKYNFGSEDAYIFLKPNFLVNLDYEKFIRTKLSVNGGYEFYLSNSKGVLIKKKNNFFSGAGSFYATYHQKYNLGIKYYFNKFLVGKLQILNEIAEYRFKSYSEYFYFSSLDFSFKENSNRELTSDYWIYSNAEVLFQLKSNRFQRLFPTTSVYSQKFKKQFTRAFVFSLDYNIGWD